MCSGGVLGINSPSVLTLNLAVALRHPSDHSCDRLRAISHLLEPRLESRGATQGAALTEHTKLPAAGALNLWEGLHHRQPRLYGWERCDVNLWVWNF